MNDFVANNMKYIIEWGQIIIVALILIAALLLYMIERKYKAFYPKRIFSFLGSVVLIAVLLICTFAFVSVTDLKLRFTGIVDGLETIKGKKASGLTFNLVSNDSIKNIEEYRNHVVLVNYWATWCPPCIHELADLNKLQETYMEKGVTIIVISNEDRDQLLKFNKKDPFKVVSGYLATFNWVDMGSARPITFLINKDGTIEDYFTGSYDYKFFESQIQKYINE